MTSVFVATLPLGCLGLALWLDVRFERLRPRSASAPFVHALAAVAALYVTADVLAYGGGPGTRLAGVLLLFVPALVYALLAAVWLIRFLAEIVRTYA